MGYLDENGLSYLWTKIKNYVNSKALTINKVYPVGSIYMSVNSTNPNSLFGGTWMEWGSGRVPVGVNTSDDDFKTSEKEGGEKLHTLSVSEIPLHTHFTTRLGIGSGYLLDDSNRGASAGKVGATDNIASGASGSGSSHNNLQPFITCYMWKRTA